MAIFRTNGKLWKADLATVKPLLGSLTKSELIEEVELYAEIVEGALDGHVECTPQDMSELVEIFNACTFEANWRLFAQNLGLTLEVR